MRRFAIWTLLLALGGYCADRALAGRYTGEWKSNSSGNGGALHMALDAAPDGSWKCEAGFTLDGAEIKAATHEIELQDSKVGRELRFRSAVRQTAFADDGRVGRERV